MKEAGFFTFIFFILCGSTRPQNNIIVKSTSPAVCNLRCEYLKDPLGIDVVNPRLSWNLEYGARRCRQTAYQVLVASTMELLAKNKSDLWDSKKVVSDRSVQVEYAGRLLASRQYCYWKVRIWDQAGKIWKWSKPGIWSMGLLKTPDWEAKWISYRNTDPTRVERSDPWLRRAFVLKNKPARAIIYVCSLSYHELYINGRKADDTVLGPAMSQLDKRALYITYDITDYLVEGRNVIGLWLGNGSFRPELPKAFHASPMVMAQLELLFPDGSRDRVSTDWNWKANPSPMSVAGLRAEIYDATRVIEGWCDPELNDSAWRGVNVVSAPPVIISAQKVQPNRIATEIHPVSVNELSPGIYEIDMGRTYVGYFQLKVHAGYGDSINMEMNELVLGSKLRQSFGQHDIYIARGTGEEMFRNRFDYRAFRYVTIRGLKRRPTLTEACGYMIQTDMDRTATFSCSNDLLNRVQAAVEWTYHCIDIGGVLVDCPHRERHGYGAEGQATMLTAMTHTDAAAMFTHWLQVWRDLQDPETGKMTHTGPKVDTVDGSPGWGGICVTLPWELYVRYGDKRILDQSYPSVRRWINFLNSKSTGHILQHYGPEDWGFYADWVAPGRQIGGRWTNAVTKESDIFFNNCYFIYNVEVAARIARALDKPEDARYYEEQARLQRLAVHSKYYDSAREVYVNGEQAYQAIALLTGVAPADQRAKLSGSLALLITEAQKGHLNTGVLGTIFLFRQLLDDNRNDLIFGMVNQHGFPGWGWLLDNGATTIGEQWGGLYSQVHSSFLSVNSWFIEGIGGIRPDPGAPGYTHFYIRPAIVGDLTWANVSYDSYQGKILSNWKLEQDLLFLNVTIPANTTATVYLPARDPATITESGHIAMQTDGARFLRMEDGCAVFDVDSGCYFFSGPAVTGNKPVLNNLK